MSIALTIVIGVVVFWSVRRLRWVWRVNRIPGLEFTPFGILGDVGFVRSFAAGDPLQNFEPTVQKYRKTVDETGLMLLWLGPCPHLVVLDADYAEAVLSNSELIAKGFQYKFAKPWLGDGLLLSSGNKWRTRRKMLTPSFHFRILEQFIPVMNRNGKILVSKLEEEAADNDGIVTDLIHFVLPCTLDVICETTMGVRMESQSDPEGQYIRAAEEASKSVMGRFLTPWLFFDTIFDMTTNGRRQQKLIEELHEFTDSAIKSRMRDMLTKDHSRDDEDVRRKEPLMDTLIREHIRHPNEFTLLDIREEVDTFMFAGHDTTAWAVVWCTYLLGHHPECQQRLQEEVDAVYAEKEENEDLTMQDLRTKLVYTEAAVKEAQRLYSSIPIIVRSATTDVKIKDYDVPAGTQIMVIANILHHNPKYWSDPMTFNPERFLSGEKHHPFAFIPFSAGPRNCIGQKFGLMEEKAVIAKIFRKFSVTSLDARDSIRPVVAATRKSDIPLRVRLQVR